jgi:hypothetical protein
MMRLGSMMVTVALGTGLAAPGASAGQEPPRKLVAPVRGEALIEITKPDTRVLPTEVVTTILIRNVSSAPIAGLTVQENWFKGNEPMSGDSYRHRRPLQVGEVIRVTLRTPRKIAAGRANQYQFSHANGVVKPTVVPKLQESKPAKD